MQTHPMKSGGLSAQEMYLRTYKYTKRERSQMNVKIRCLEAAVRACVREIAPCPLLHLLPLGYLVPTHEERIVE